jgi:hypothetical protein
MNSGPLFAAKDIESSARKLLLKTSHKAKVEALQSFLQSIEIRDTVRAHGFYINTEGNVSIEQFTDISLFNEMSAADHAMALSPKGAGFSPAHHDAFMAETYQSALEYIEKSRKATSSKR